MSVIVSPNLQIGIGSPSQAVLFESPVILDGSVIIRRGNHDENNGGVLSISNSHMVSSLPMLHAAAVSSTSNQASFNCGVANRFTWNLTTGSITAAFTNVPAGTLYTLMLNVSAPGTLPTITWPASFVWQDNIAPVLSNGVRISLTTSTAGSSWYGSWTR